MKLQKTTWGLLITALLLGGFVYFFEIQNQPQKEEIEAKQKKIFDFAESEIKSLTIETKGKTLRFERTEKETNTWNMKQPEDKLANDASVSYLLNLLVEGKSERSFSIPANQLKDYGLERPLATITIELSEQKTHQIVLGKSDFKDEFIYAQIDPQKPANQELTITLVTKDFSYAIDRDLSEWKQPEPTPTPSEKPSNSQESAPKQSPETPKTN